MRMAMRLFGHPVHPMLVHFPLALWSIGSVSDCLALLGFHELWRMGSLAIGGGLILGLPAIIAGLIDYVTLRERVLALANTHMMLMGLAWLAYLAAIFMRSGEGLVLISQPDPVPVAASLAGFALLAVGAWFGGQMVYRFGVGVHQDIESADDNCGQSSREM